MANNDGDRLTFKAALDLQVNKAKSAISDFKSFLVKSLKEADKATSGHGPVNKAKELNSAYADLFKTIRKDAKSATSDIKGMKRELKEGIRDTRTDFHISAVIEKFRREIRTIGPALKTELNNLKPQLKNAFSELSNSFKSTKLYSGINYIIKPYKDAIKNLIPDIRAWRGVQHDTAQQGEVDIEALRREYELLGRTIETDYNIVSNPGSADRNTSILQLARQRVQHYEELRRQIEAYDNAERNTGTTENEHVSRIQRLISALHGLSEAFRNALTSESRMWGLSDLRNGLNSLINTVKRVKGSFSSATTHIKNLYNAAKQLKQTAIDNIFNRTGKATESFGKKLRKAVKVFIKYTFAVRSFFFLYRKIRKAVSEGLGSLVLVDDRTNKSISDFKTALNTLRGSLASAFSPIINVIAPILTRFMNLLDAVINKIGMFIAYLTGQKTYYKAVSVYQDYAESLQDTADAANNASEATKDYLSGLDEIRKWDSGKDSGSGGGAGGGSGNDPTQGLTWTEVEIPDSIKNLADTLKSYFESQDWDGLGKFVADKINGIFEKLYELVNWDNVGPKITPVINGITSTFNSLVDNIDWDLVGRTFGAGVNTIVNSVDLLLTGIDWKNLGSKIAEGVRGLVTEIDWENLGKTIADGINVPIDAMNGFVTKMSQINFESGLSGWQEGGLAIANAINGLMDNIHWDELAQNVSEGLKGVLSGLSTAVQNIDWKQLGEDIKDFLINIDWNGISDALFEAIGSIIGGIGEFLVGLFGDAIDALVEWWNESAFDETGKFTLEGLFKAIGKAFVNIGTWIKDHILTPFIDGIKKVFQINSPAEAPEIVDAGENIGWGILESIAGVFKNIGSWIKEHVLDKIADAIGKVIEIGVALVQSGWSTVSDWLKGFGDWTQEKISQGVELVKEGWDNVKGFIKKAGDWTKDIVEQEVELIKKGWDNVKGFIKKAGDWTKDIVEQEVELIKKGWDNVKGFIKKAGDWTKDIVEQEVSLVKKGWDSFKAWLTGNDDENAPVEVEVQPVEPAYVSHGHTNSETGDYDATSYKTKVLIDVEKDGKLAEYGSPQEWIKSLDAESALKEKLELKKSGVLATEGSPRKVAISYDKGNSTIKEKLTTVRSDNLKKYKSPRKVALSFDNGNSLIEEKLTVKRAGVLAREGSPRKVAKSLDHGNSLIEEKLALRKSGILDKEGSPRKATQSYDNGNSTINENVDLQKGNWSGKTPNGWTQDQVTGNIGVGVDISVVNETLFEERLTKAAQRAMNKGINFALPVATGGILPFARGGIIRNMSRLLSTIPHYASGTTRPHGTMFVAGEAGPEIIGHINGQTEILNKSQLAATMYSAIVSGAATILQRFATLLFAHMNFETSSVVNAINNWSRLSNMSIPAIARGAVLPANGDFMSAVNSGLTGRSGISEDTMRQIVREESASRNYEFVAQINRRTLFDEFIQEAKLRQMQTGKNPFEFA